MTPERIRKNWMDGLMNLVGLKRAYAVGIITKAQYKEIKALPQKGNLL